MERHGRKAVRGLVLVLSVLTVVAAVFVLEGILAKDTGGRWPWFSGASVQSPGIAKITYVQKFTRCGDVTTSVTEIPEDELESAVAALASGWTVSRAGSSSAVAQKDVDEYCPDHLDFRLIALYRGAPGVEVHVCVFRGKKIDSAFIAKERRDLTEDVLYPQDRQRLRVGLLVTYDDEDPADVDLDEKVDSYLQGIAEGR